MGTVLKALSMAWFVGLILDFEAHGFLGLFNFCVIHIFFINSRKLVAG